MSEDAMGRMGLSVETWAMAEAAVEQMAPHGVVFPAGRPSMVPPFATSRM